MINGQSSSSDFLQRMAASSQQRVAAAQSQRTAAMLRTDIAKLSSPPSLTLQGFDVIAEVKQRSPAAGSLAASSFDMGDQIAAYVSGGAAAISVLTEPDQFLGSLDDLAAAAKQLQPLGIPAMRKDFLVDSYQLLEARAAGAGGVLLIIAILDDQRISAMMDDAEELGLFVLLEAFSADDIRRGATLLAQRQAGKQPVLFGINCRDLTTLQIDFERFETFGQHLPVGFDAVAESGLTEPHDAEQVAQWGYRLALVGSALMTASDPAAALAAMLAAGRGVCEPRHVR